MIKTLSQNSGLQKNVFCCVVLGNTFSHSNLRDGTSLITEILRQSAAARMAGNMALAILCAHVGVTLTVRTSAGNS